MTWYRLFYHVVWTTKHRLPFIIASNRDAIFGSIAAKCERLDGLVHALNGMEDHLHLVITIPPTIALSNFVGQVKGNSSFVASKLPDADPTFAWQQEFSVLTFSESLLAKVVEYVRNQEQHHTMNTTDRQLEPRA
ncbi:MAG: IS200/IS605 family transposase [Anaerolineae bacterium]|nr:IS200/IS605 family transposase [Anaerolineae bacterium]